MGRKRVLLRGKELFPRPMIPMASHANNLFLVNLSPLSTANTRAADLILPWISESKKCHHPAELP